ncbi:MAG: S9 family peptidase [Ilumatobacter sp.]|nr:S9 family peptidase [Ilumatobacter sp.]
MSTLPYGTWPSPVSADDLTAGVTKLIDVWVDGDRTVWHEGRPSEGGRQTLVVADDDGTRDLLHPPFNVRSGVHEYGGGAAWVEHDTAWFVNWDDQRIWRIDLDDTEPVPLTPETDHPRTVRYADLRRSPDGAWLVAIQEVHDVDDPHHVVNRVVVLPADTPGVPHVVHAAHDFVMSPRFVADDRIRFVAWNHPNMPWNDTELLECSFDPSHGTTGPARSLAAGASFMQPDGAVAISDRDGVWNLWQIDDAERPLTDGPDEIGGPAWIFGLRDHVRLPDGRRVWATGGRLHVDGDTLDTGAAALEQLAPSDGAVTAIVRWPDRPSTVTRFDLATGATTDVVPAPPTPLRDGDVSTPERIEYPTAGGATAYGWFYPPANADVTGPDGERPPLVVTIHGGPTSCARPWFALGTQFWTTRGFAVVDVDHRGSSGYGTAFRDLLDGNWGIVDVEDCIAAAEYLAADGSVDGDRMVIRGGSAGGFTVLASLTSGDVFAAGACSYGIADLSVLAADTHKFESRYTDRLIGPWPEARDVYEARSPIHHLDRFDTPLIVFQGLDDKVVPPNQSEMIVEALRAKGVECEYHAYEGEGHGFRRADTIVDQITNELAFYRRVLQMGSGTFWHDTSAHTPAAAPEGA